MLTPLLAVLLQGAVVGWTEGPAFESLQAAAAVPAAGLSLERQSAQAGASFTGGRSPDAAVAASGRHASAVQIMPREVSSAGRARVPPPDPLTDKERTALRNVRAAGAAAAGVGLGLLGYAVAASTAGPIVAATALIFFGGLCAYLAHRRLHGKKDF